MKGQSTTQIRKTSFHQMARSFGTGAGLPTGCWRLLLLGGEPRRQSEGPGLACSYPPRTLAVMTYQISRCDAVPSIARSSTEQSWIEQIFLRRTLSVRG